MVGVHPNTIRMYERIGFISAPTRSANGYREFTDEHLLQARLVRLALQVELVQSGLRTEALAIIKAAARRDYAQALALNADRMAHLDKELSSALEAVRIVEGLLTHTEPDIGGSVLTRAEAAAQLNTTIDALRNWEMNGLLQVKRRRNGYRVYGPDDMNRLAVIRALRLANYSLASILRLLETLDDDPKADIGATLDKPDPDEDILSVCDELVTSLRAAIGNARSMGGLIKQLKAWSPGLD